MSLLNCFWCRYVDLEMMDFFVQKLSHELVGGFEPNFVCVDMTLWHDEDLLRFW